MRKSKYFLLLPHRELQMVGLQQDQGREEWASEGDLNVTGNYRIHSRGAGESTPLTKSAYVSMHERVSVTPSRVAPQERMNDRIRTALVPAIGLYCVG